MLEGARHVRSRRPVVLALAVLGAHRLGMGVVTVVTILLCRAHLADPADVDAGLALLGAAVALTGAGYGAAALVTPPLTRRMGLDRCVAAGTAVAAVAVLAVAAALTLAPGATLPVLLASGFVLGVASQTVKICIDAVLQRGVAEAYLGRVFSLHDIVFNGCFVAAAAVAALVLPPDGASPAVVAAAAALYGAVALALQVTPLGHVPGVGGYRAEA
jgi:MFS family permease